MQGKCARINLSQAAFGVILKKESQVAFCKHFKFQNRRFGAFEAGY
jgi:hypothetical protein